MRSLLLSTNEAFACIKVFQRLTSEVRSHWDALVNGSISTPYQSAHWYESWLNTAGRARNEEPFIVVAFDASDRPTLILPLVITRRGSVAVATFPGGKHSNYNFPLVRSDVAFTGDAMDIISAKVADTSIEVDLYWFDALPSTWVGKQNPLLGKPRYRHAAVSSVLDLKGGMLTRRLPLRLRSSDRRLRKLGTTVTRAHGATEVEVALRAFFAQKSDWFRTRKLPNSFEQDGIPRFFQEVFSGKGEGELHTLTLDGATLAVTGMLVTPERASLMFISYDQHHEATKLSPGTHLLRWLVNDLAERGIAEFDFGLGDAEYKRLLGAMTEPVFVSMKAITAKGRIMGAAFALSNALKAYIKQSPRFFRLLQSLHCRTQMAWYRPPTDQLRTQ